MNTPVALFVFNRPATTLRVFNAIGAVRPTRLLLIADGPRADKADEAAACLQVRDIISRVDWPCEVSTNFAGSNLGCRERVISGLNWVFSLVGEAIILEDDCLPDTSFFPFCEQMLAMYRDDNRVAAITGTNLAEQHTSIGPSYFFSVIGGCWGWATWKSEWARYDPDMTDWPAMKKEGVLADIFMEARSARYWTEIFDAMYEHRGPNTWDYQWFYTRLKNNGLTICPRVNAVANIGFGADATHTLREDSRFTKTAGAIEFPLSHPPAIVANRRLDRNIQDLLTPGLAERAARKLLRIPAALQSRLLPGKET